MRALLDTNSFLWFISGSDRLSGDAKNFIADMQNQLVLSAASLWEIAIKVSLGKLDLRQPYGQLIPQQLEEKRHRRTAARDRPLEQSYRPAFSSPRPV